MDELRYLNLGHVEAKYEAAIWEFPDWLQPLQPTLIVRQPAKDELGCLGVRPLDNLVNTEALAGIDICRFRIPNADSPGMLHRPSALHIHLVLPTVTQSWASRMLKATIFRTLKAFDVACEQTSNDIFVVLRGRRRKFSGQIITVRDDWLMVACTVTFDLNYDLARQVYKLDTPKFIQKGNISDISDIIVGLHEVQPDLEPSVFLADLIQKLSERLELKVLASVLTASESESLNALAARLGLESWTKDGIWPESSSTLNNI
jgi:hypothetical protein